MSVRDKFNAARLGDFLDKPGLGGETYLTRAVKMGEAETIREFINLGAKPDTRNAHGEYPLDLALALRDARSIELLVAYDADIYRKVNGKTFRQRAQEANFPEAIETAKNAERMKEAFARALSMGGYL